MCMIPGVVMQRSYSTIHWLNIEIVQCGPNEICAPHKENDPSNLTGIDLG